VSTFLSCLPDFLINLLGLLPDDQPADDERGGNACGVSQQACGEGVAAAADGD